MLPVTVAEAQWIEALVYPMFDGGSVTVLIAPNSKTVIGIANGARRETASL